MGRALRLRVNLVVQGWSPTKPPFWQVKYLQTRVLYVAQLEPAVFRNWIEPHPTGLSELEEDE